MHTIHVLLLCNNYIKKLLIDQGKCQTVDILTKESSQSMQDKLTY